MMPATLPAIVKEKPFGELVAFITLTGIGAFLVISSWQYEVVTPAGRVSGGFMPLLAGAALLGLAGVKTLTTLRRVRSLAADRAELEAREAQRSVQRQDVDIFGRSGKQRLRQLILVFAALVVAAALVPVFGLLGALFLMSLFISAVVERRSWWATLTISITSIGLVWLIFVALLGIPLPHGLILGSILGG